jgi:dolichol-phosphate mannosyltransferase
MTKVLVAVPTYNEIENIRSLIDAIFTRHPHLTILVIDDNSPDGTGDLVAQIAASNDRVKLIRREGKLGLGSAYLTAFQYGIDNFYDGIIQMDADFSHNPAYLNTMIDNLESYDLVIGSRYVPGGGVKNWGIIRRFVSRWGSFYARIILGIHTRDLTGGFNAWRVSSLKELPLDKVNSEGYSFQIEMKYLALKNNMSVMETPILFEDRTLGKSKMSTRVFVEAAFRVWDMRLQSKRRLIKERHNVRT